MVKIDVIYTPEASYFRRGEIDMLYPMHPSRIEVKKLRASYKKLQERFPNLPEKVGIVSYSEIFKRGSLKDSEEIDNPTTTYLPLDILKQCLAVKDIGTEDSLDRECGYRKLSYLTRNRALLMDKTLPEKCRRTLMMACGIPSAEGIQIGLNGMEKVITSNAREISAQFQSTRKAIKKCYPGWQQLEEVYEYILNRFKQNKVSEEFPLVFLPPGLFPTEQFSVNLRDEIVVPEIAKIMMGYLEVGCRVSGMKKVPRKMKRDFDLLTKDLFAETKREDSIDHLLEGLPEPKTIITDTYIVDAFPRLSELGFEAREYNPFKSVSLE